MNVIIYCRVSTDEQEESGLSLEAQEAVCRAEVERRGWTVAEVVLEECSTRKKRPLLGKSLEQVRHRSETGIDGIVVAEMDRVCRRLVEFVSLLEEALERGFVLLCLDLDVDTSEPNGMFFAQIRAAASQWERAMISKRTRLALAALRERGVKLGAPRRITPETEAYIRELRGGEKGPVLSYRQIARRLNQEGVQTVSGGTWASSTVAAVVKR